MKVKNEPPIQAFMTSKVKFFLLRYIALKGEK